MYCCHEENGVNVMRTPSMMRQSRLRLYRSIVLHLRRLMRMLVWACPDPGRLCLRSLFIVALMDTFVHCSVVTTRLMIYCNYLSREVQCTMCSWYSLCERKRKNDDPPSWPCFYNCIYNPPPQTEFVFAIRQPSLMLNQLCYSTMRRRVHMPPR